MSDWDNLDKSIEVDSVPIKRIAASKIASSLEEENIRPAEANDENDVGLVLIIIILIVF